MPASLTCRTASLALLAALSAATLGGADRSGGAMDIDPPPAVNNIPAPHLTVAEALSSFEIEKGFAVSAIISEPAIIDPVAMAIDEDGRLFVVEMRGYMLDTEGKGEDSPIGRISVHEEPDANGVYQKHAVFLDNLVLPRAISFCAHGLLFADQNALYVVPRVGARATGAPQVIDPTYAGQGNVEHRASGCLLGLDNWYYSANCGFRYRLRAGRWERDITEAHGQWGITQDDYGRLMTNNNSLAMQGDVLPPTASLRNPAFKWQHARTSYLAPDNLVFPIRVNPGCNRAYIRSGGKDGGFHQEVGDDWRLRTYTAGCAPLIYRGGAFGQANDSIFVPEPAGNLVMRYSRVHEDSGTTQVTHANPGHAFFASTDERFRPVYTYVGPQGELYVVDMHKGILQHKAYMTAYLKRQVKERHLEDEGPAGYGRIWRITATAPAAPAGAAARPAMSTQSSPELLAYLGHGDSWWRETAQRVLIERGEPAMVAPLAALAASSDNPLARVHALWTLEGLGGLTVPMLEAAAKGAAPRVIGEILRLAEGFSATPQAEAAGALVKALTASARSPEVLLAAALHAGPLAAAGSASAWQAVAELAKNREALMREALISGLGGGEAEAVKRLEGVADKELIAELKQCASTRAGMRPEALSRAPKVMLLLSAADSARQNKAVALPPGQSKFLEICAVCHSPDGKGMFGLGPPLAGSEWVAGDKKNALRIVLVGLGGPLTVAGKAYKQPDIGPLMPGLAGNLKDEEIAGVLTFLRTAFGNRADAVSAAEVAAERKVLGNRSDPFTAEELSGKAPAK